MPIVSSPLAQVTKKLASWRLLASVLWWSKEWPSFSSYLSCCWQWRCPLQWRIMSAMVSQITGVSSVYSSADQRKHQSSASLAFVRGIHVVMNGGFPSQRTSDAETVSIWWRHHVVVAERATIVFLVFVLLLTLALSRSGKAKQWE